MLAEWGSLTPVGVDGVEGYGKELCEEDPEAADDDDDVSATDAVAVDVDVDNMDDEMDDEMEAAMVGDVGTVNVTGKRSDEIG